MFWCLGIVKAIPQCHRWYCEKNVVLPAMYVDNLVSRLQRLILR